MAQPNPHSQSFHFENGSNCGHGMNGYFHNVKETNNVTTVASDSEKDISKEPGGIQAPSNLDVDESSVVTHEETHMPPAIQQEDQSLLPGLPASDTQTQDPVSAGTLKQTLLQLAYSAYNYAKH
ncbi:hypothetical protein VKT23_006260 [Stygiomarasmius scandens]|uniref:Uncharacterized protein n=1 Tax=Marasmiellus scandens TaxID=2682957 RepID=A0ABR1JSZ5_9AGAR